VYVARTCCAQLPQDRTLTLHYGVEFVLRFGFDVQLGYYSHCLEPIFGSPQRYPWLCARKRKVSITHTILLCSRTGGFRKAEKAASIKSSLPGNSLMLKINCLLYGRFQLDPKLAMLVCQNSIEYLQEALRTTSTGQK
jgi:hypothetical protein